MKEVFDFAQGKMRFKEFERCFHDKPEVWSFLQNLVPFHSLQLEKCFLCINLRIIIKT